MFILVQCTMSATRSLERNDMQSPVRSGRCCQRTGLKSYSPFHISYGNKTSKIASFYASGNKLIVERKEKKRKKKKRKEKKKKENPVKQQGNNK